MIEFKNVSDFPKHTLYNQLVDAYSFNKNCKNVQFFIKTCIFLSVFL